MSQKIITSQNNYRGLDDWIAEHGLHCIFAVCDESIKFLDSINTRLTELEKTGVQIIRFSDFQPNPLYESVVNGVDLFRKNRCDSIIAIGGGSAMDVAKCIKLYSSMNGSECYLRQTVVPNDLPFLAMPTTAGTGSEATRYAVIYCNGIKQSVTDISCIPQTVLLDSSVLKTLPLYQKKSTMLDALCHAIESFWSVNSTEESRRYSRKAVTTIMANMSGYLRNDDSANEKMLLAANTAGRAINITQTTAGHAMCYKITTLFGCAHGHAAALCDRVLFPWMLKNTDKCIDARGEQYLKGVFSAISEAMGCKTPEEAAELFNKVFYGLELAVPSASPEQFAVLKNSVNTDRLRNHPEKLDEAVIDALYHKILNEG